MRLRLSVAWFLVALALVPQLVLAQNEPAQPADPGSLGDFGIPKSLDTLSGKGEQGEQILAQETEGDIGIFFRERVALIINFMLGLVGAIAVLMGIISGYMYLTAFGNEERATSAKKTIFYAAIGLALSFGVWTILQLFGEFVGSAGKNIKNQRQLPAAEHGLEEQL